MRWPRLAALVLLIRAAASPAAEEPPAAWFLNAHGTGGDYVYFSVGGTAETPPRSSREVLLGWSWNEAGTAVERYPGSAAARYRPSRISGKQPWQWHADVRRIGAPRLGIGPGRELLLLGDDDGSTATAMRWAELLDSVEAAYRHSSPDLSGRERRGAIEVGRAGRCQVLSVPVDGDTQGWSTLRLPDHARPSRSGGFYYVDRVADARDRRTVEVQRFQRFLAGDGDCGGFDLDLSLFPAPRQEAFNPPYFMVWSGVELPELSLLDLEPTPRTPSVRTLSHAPATAQEQINIATWPAAGAGGIDLCRAPFMATLCLKDLRIREQLATAATSDPAVAGPITRGCRDFFDRLPSVPSPHPCTDPRVWRRVLGTYRTGYTGEMVLRDEPRLTSRTDASGDVQWLWSDDRAPSRAARFPLADGTRIELGLPRTAPPPIVSSSAASGSTPRPPAADVAPPPPSRPGTSAPQPPPSQASASVPPPPAASPLPAPPPPAPSQAGTPAAGTPAATADPQTPPESPAGRPTAGIASGAEPGGSVLGPTAPTALTQRLLWPIVLAALAMTVLVALLLRGHRASTRAHRRPLPDRLIAERVTPDLVLETNGGSERLLAGTAAAEPPAALLLPEAGPSTGEAEPGEEIDDEVEEVEPIDDEVEAGEEVEPDEEVEPGEEVEPAVAPPAPVLPLEPPKLSESPPPPADSPWGRLDRQWRALENRERQGIGRSLAAITRLSDWVSCLLPVLERVELERLPAPAEREWRESYRALHEFADVDAVAFHRLRRQLSAASSTAPAPGSGDAETAYLESAGLLDPERGTLPERLRRHLLRPGSGRLQTLALALQYMIEAFPVEHLEKSERKAYLGAVRERLRAKGLSTKFHRMIEDLAAGLGLSYRPAKYYKTPIDEGAEYEVVNLSERVGYPAGAEDRVIVRLSELFLSDAGSGERASGRALIDGGS